MDDSLQCVPEISGTRRAARDRVSAPVRIGTSGWEYAHWRGDFYPADLPKARWFEHYARHFDTVELNSSFYRLPRPEAFDGWRRKAPGGFVYAVKASRYLTHVKRLSEPAEPLERMWTRAKRLGDRLGPVLYQLPPRWAPNLERLESFLAAIPRDHAQAVEFRDRRWYAAEVSALLAAARVALCLHDMVGSAPPAADPVGPFVYLRFHGSGARYGGRYGDEALRAWADRIGQWASAGLPVWAYFNNDIGGHAVRDAVRLREMVDGLSLAR
jgi:uncharacterized protein YecE (DUF72 family)